MVTYSLTTTLSVYKLTNVKTGEIIIGTKDELPKDFVYSSIRTSMSRNALYKGIYKCEIIDKRIVECEVNKPTMKRNTEIKKISGNMKDTDKTMKKPIVKGVNDIDTYTSNAKMMGVNYGEYVAMKDGFISKNDLRECRNDGCF